MTTPSEIMEHEAHRSRVYRVLANAYNPPVPELVDALNRLKPLLAQLESTALDIAARLSEAFGSPGDIEPLKVDFARLFVGPFLLLAPPYGSVYLEGERRIMGESTVDARDHYLSLGLDIANDFKEAPDHVSAELEFMHVLVCREVEAINAGDRDRLMDSLHQQHVFLGNHLGAWIPGFTSKLIEHAETDFYRILGEVTRRFIAEERRALDIQVLDKENERFVRDTSVSHITIPAMN